MTNGGPCINQVGVSRCTGCGGCESACARGAVALSLDADGFYKPVVLPERCNECGQCEARCPVIPDAGHVESKPCREPQAFAAWASNARTRVASSSGGIFSELARPVVEAGGAVVGCVWGERWTPAHVVARTLSAVEGMRGSKYVPSYMGTTYHQVLSELRDREGPVLFSGAPCQVAAMARALGPRLRDRVLLVDFFCHGVPSLRAFHVYQHELFAGQAIARYTFRDKTLGWQTVTAEAADGRRYQRDILNDPFGRGFVLENLYLMEACYRCSFAGIPRAGDVTLGDYWGCPEEWHDRRGVSLVLANTAAGLRALTSMASSAAVTLKSTDVAKATVHNRCGPTAVYPVPRHRRAFLDGLARGDRFSQLASRYFAGKWQALWRSFRQSDSKTRFAIRIVRDVARRIRGKGTRPAHGQSDGGSRP